ncbi:MAG: galactose mutarotase [Rhodobacteraceae bacterium]|nr:galactose mutarotase [Paracoccaceae bacterium]
MTREVFGTLADGRTVERLTIAAGGLTARILTLGAILQDVRIDGLPRSLTVGSDRLADYEGDLQYHGPIAGPVANRIGGAEAMIAGRPFRFTANEGPNTLHGGSAGTHRKLWRVEDHRADALTLALDLPDGEGGFPGNRSIAATFAAEAPATLTLTIRAMTDAPTLINLTNHSYWQLSPDPRATQTLTCPAETRVALDPAKIPTGAVTPVAGTAFDFRNGAAVGAGAFDLCLCLAPGRRALTPAATLDAGGLRLDVETTEAGLQIYDGHPGGGLAIEAQNWPGAAQHPQFPTDLLLPGETRVQVTRWRLSRPG